MSEPSEPMSRKEQLAQMLREFPTWEDAALHYRDCVEELKRELDQAREREAGLREALEGGKYALGQLQDCIRKDCEPTVIAAWARRFLQEGGGRRFAAAHPPEGAYAEFVQPPNADADVCHNPPEGAAEKGIQDG